MKNIYICICSLCIVKTENEMQLSVAFKNIEFMMCCSSLFIVLYCVLCFTKYGGLAFLSLYLNVWYASGAKTLSCALSTGYTGFMISYFTFVIQNVFCVSIDKRAHLAVKILYGIPGATSTKAVPCRTIKDKTLVLHLCWTVKDWNPFSYHKIFKIKHLLCLDLIRLLTSLDMFAHSSIFSFKFNHSHKTSLA